MGIGSSYKHYLLFAGKPIDGTPSVVGQQTIFTGAVVFPFLRADLIIVGDEGLTEDLVNSSLICTTGNDSSTVLQLRFSHNSDSLSCGLSGFRCKCQTLCRRSRHQNSQQTSKNSLAFLEHVFYLLCRDKINLVLHAAILFSDYHLT